jgi:hypothetical protein
METDRPRPVEINPYAAPATPIDAPHAASLLDLTRDEVQGYVGGKHAYYWHVWQRAATRGGLTTRFNWAAFLLNSSWLLYRKLFREFWMFTAATTGVSCLVSLIGGATGRKLFGVDLIASLALSAMVGVLGNGLYLRRARRIIGAVRAETADPERRMRLLASRGGTSWLWALSGLVVVIVLSKLIPR